MPVPDDRLGGLLTWQWSLYPQGHRHRSNLILHALTVPFFWAGTLGLLASAPLRSGWLALAGVAALGLALFLQGRGHKKEHMGPVPFRGPLDVLARLFVEQWITFPRYVLSGEFARAWR